MARNETILSVFVASPGEVADERKRLERVVDELNFVWSRQFRLRLELVKWETHAYSGIGEDAQDVINKQLDDFDIFLGIMWKRFGEPTGRAESGTEEEFKRARERYARERGRTQIMFYFRDSPPAQLSEVDPKQWAAVNQFRSEVAAAGVFYWTYESPSEFETLARQHLSRQVQGWGKSWGGVIEDSGTRQSETVVPKDEPPLVREARSITAIVFEQMAHVERLQQSRLHDPEVIHRSFLEAQIILDSSPDNDELGQIAAQQAAALVTVALAGRLESSESAQRYVANVCNCVLGLRGLSIDWQKRDASQLFELAAAAQERHDDEVLVWIKDASEEEPH